MSKRTLLYIGILFTTVSCDRNHPLLQSGDLLFQAGKTSDMTGAITAATGADGTLNYTHVGIALRTDGRDSVIEASTQGVRIVALEEFLADAGLIGGHPAVVAMRLRDTTGTAKAIGRARGFLGLPYDYAFRPDNGRLYCSELVWESFRQKDGTPLFRARPMNFRAADGSMPSFWTELFGRAGEPVPEGVPGTNPNDLAREPLLTEVGRWF